MSDLWIVQIYKDSAPGLPPCTPAAGTHRLLRPVLQRPRIISLAELLAAHETHAGALGTMLVKRVPAAKASECGEVVADPVTKELLHYTERPVRTLDFRSAWELQYFAARTALAASASAHSCAAFRI